MRQAVLVALTLGAASLVGAQQPIILVPGTQVRAPTSPPADGFGRAVGGRGDQAFGFGAGLVVGAPFAQGAGGLRSGRVYDYVDPVDVDEVTIIDSPAPTAEGRFGAAVAGVNFETLVVGAPGENGGAGALYRALNPVTPPPFDPVVTPFTAHSPTAGESFGAALAAASGRVLAGAPGFGASGLAGAAYLLDPFNLDAPPVELRRPAPTPGAFFGAAVALSSDGLDAVVGAPFEGAPGAQVGAAHLFDAAAGGFVRTFSNPRGGVKDGFGFSVAAEGGLVVVGAPFADAGAESAGEVHVFDRTGALLRTIPSPSPGSGAAFGAAVALVGERILVGAPLDDADAPDGGAVYQFDGSPVSPSFGAPLDPARLPVPTPAALARLGWALARVGNAGDVVAGAPGRDGAVEGQALVFAACGNGVQMPPGEQCDLGVDNGPGSACSDLCVKDASSCGGDGMSASFPIRTFAAAPTVVVDCGCGAGDAGSCGGDVASACAVGQCTGIPNECRVTPGTSCNDGNRCTVDTCDVAVGCVNQPVLCPDDGDPCTVDECNPATGDCSRRALGCNCGRDNLCDDGDTCNGGERCTLPRDCNGCDLLGGALPCCAGERTCQLEFPAPPPGSTCNDGNLCTAADVCRESGACAGDALAGVAIVCCVFQQRSALAACDGQPAGAVREKIDRGATLAAQACQATRLRKQRKLVRREIKVLVKAQRLAGALARRRNSARRISEACRDALVQDAEGPAAPARAFLATPPAG